MQKQTFGSCAGLLASIAIAGFISGGIAAFFGLTLGGIGAAVAPDFHYGLVGDLVCPAGTTFEYRQVKYSFHQPGEYTIEASCVDNEGQEIGGQEFKAIGAVMGMYFLVCFVPLFFLGIVFSWVLIRLLAKITKKSSFEIISG